LVFASQADPTTEGAFWMMNQNAPSVVTALFMSRTGAQLLCHPLVMRLSNDRDRRGLSGKANDQPSGQLKIAS
jgi:hypothetical protein